MISTNNDMDEFHLESLKMFSHIQRKHSFKTIKIKFDDSEMITVIYIHIELRVDIFNAKFVIDMIFMLLPLCPQISEIW